MIFYWLLFAIFAAINMQAGVVKTNSVYIYTYSDNARKVTVSNLPPICMKRRDLTLRKMQVGYSDISTINHHSRVLARPCNNQELLSMADSISAVEGVNPSLVRAIIQTESGFCVGARIRRGALGLMQLMSDTARRFGVLDSFNPHQNITGGVKYFKWLINNFKGDIYKTVAAYNAGEAAVARYNGIIPPFAETRAYVPMVLQRYYQYMAHVSSGFSRQTKLRSGLIISEIAAKQVAHDASRLPVCVYSLINASGRL